jgi:alkaline phosphatase
LDQAVNAALQRVSLQDTLVLVTADHSHVFNIAGYPLRPQIDLPYPVAYAPFEYMAASHGNILTAVYDLNTTTGGVELQADANGVPYTALLYGNGPGYRVGGRVDPFVDPFPGANGLPTSGPEDPNFRQDAAVPMGSETHSAEDVAIYAWGPLSSRLRGTQKNTITFQLMKAALGL